MADTNLNLVKKRHKSRIVFNKDFSTLGEHLKDIRSSINSCSTYNTKTENLRPIKEDTNVNIIKDADVYYIENKSDNIHDIDDTTNIKNIDVEDVKDVKDMKDTKDAKDIENVGDVKDVKDMKNNEVANKKNLAMLIRKFIEETIHGQFSGLYKRGIIQSLSQNDFKARYAIILVNYYNVVYDAIVQGNDEYFVNYFNKFCELVDHSKTYYLNILMQATLKAYANINIDDLDKNSYDGFMTSVTDVARAILDDIEMALPGWLYDEDVIDNSDLIVGKPFFNVTYSVPRIV